MAISLKSGKELNEESPNKTKEVDAELSFPTYVQKSYRKFKEV